MESIYPRGISNHADVSRDHGGTDARGVDAVGNRRIAQCRRGGSRAEAAGGNCDGCGEFDLRMRGGKDASGRADGAREFGEARSFVFCVCGARHGGDRAGAELFHGTAAVFAFDCDLARWAVGVHDAAAGYRVARGSGDCRGFEGGVRAALREGRRDAIVIARG